MRRKDTVPQMTQANARGLPKPTPFARNQVHLAFLVNVGHAKRRYKAQTKVAEAVVQRLLQNRRGRSLKSAAFPVSPEQAKNTLTKRTLI